MPTLLGLLVLALVCWIGGATRAQAPSPPDGSGAAKGDYVLGTGDRIRATVFQSPELSLEMRIPEGGIVPGRYAQDSLERTP
jgi:hypothetical protein